MHTHAQTPRRWRTRRVPDVYPTRTRRVPDAYPTRTRRVPDAYPTRTRRVPDASTRAFTLQRQPDAYRSRPLRTPPDVVSVYRTNPTQWTQCVHGQTDA